MVPCDLDGTFTSACASGKVRRSCVRSRMKNPKTHPSFSAGSTLHSVPTKPGWTALVDFREEGLTIADWSRMHGFNPSLVYQVLNGSRKCFRGQSFKIARALGMK